MKKKPRSVIAAKNRLKHEVEHNSEQILQAMQEAMDALDQKSQEAIALRRIIISERAQVIYYTEKYRAHVARECLELSATGFLDLTEEQQEKYVKLAIKELECADGTIPHDPEAAKVEPGKKIILQ